MMSPGIILFLALFHLAIDWIGMLKYYFHPSKVNISSLQAIASPTVFERLFDESIRSIIILEYG